VSIPGDEQACILTCLPNVNWQAAAKLRRLVELGMVLREVQLSIAHRVTFQQSSRASNPSIFSGLPNTLPINFARAPNGYVFFSNGLNPIMKWDGVSFSAKKVGVPAPTVAPTLAITGTGAFTGEFTYYQRWLDGSGNPSNLSPVSNAVQVTEGGLFVYSNVERPTDEKIVRRQILRNTAGQALVYYVDIETDDLASMDFISARSEDELATREAVALFDSDGNSLADRFTIPPDTKPILRAYLDRMFAAGDAVYEQGHIEATAGSATVIGVGTSWSSSLAGRFLYAVGVGRVYEIASVDVANQTLTLTSVWTDISDPFVVYTIRSSPAERQLVYFSEAGYYEAWPATNGLSLEENGDQTTGLMVADSFLYILQRRHIYRLSYHLGPLVDGGLFLAARRGCVNGRCWVYFDGKTYMLDEQGVYTFSGAEDTGSLSMAIQDIFRLNDAVSSFRINWKASRWFHALLCKDERTIRWFVALGGSRLPRHAICLNLDSNIWWVEEYAFSIGHSTLTDEDVGRPIVCGPARRVYLQGIGTLDGPDGQAGTTRGNITASTRFSFTDGDAHYPATGLVGSPIIIVDGRGKWQSNVIASVNSTTIQTIYPWLVQPDTTSQYQLGGIRWLWMSGFYRWLNEEGDQQRRIEIVFPPCPTRTQCDVRVYREFSTVAEVYGYDWPTTPAEYDGVHVSKDSREAIVDFTNIYGFAQIRRSGRRERYIQKADVFSVELEGISGASSITIYEINLEGAV
jgi:hypothetical protein